MPGRTPRQELALPVLCLPQLRMIVSKSLICSSSITARQDGFTIHGDKNFPSRPAPIGPLHNRFRRANHPFRCCAYRDVRRHLGAPAPSRGKPSEGALPSCCRVLRGPHRRPPRARNAASLSRPIAGRAQTNRRAESIAMRRNAPLRRDDCKCFFDKHLEIEGPVANMRGRLAKTAPSVGRWSACVIGVFTLSRQNDLSPADARRCYPALAGHAGCFNRFHPRSARHCGSRRRTDRRCAHRRADTLQRKMHSRWMRAINRY